MPLEAFFSRHVVLTSSVIACAHQLGVPIPVLPVLVWTGAMTYSEPLVAAGALVASALAGLVGDLVLYGIGRRFGFRVLKLICRLTISPDSCVHQTALAFDRRGPSLLITGSLLPGIGTIASPLAGALRLPLATYLIYDGAGSFLRSALGIALGFVFHGQVTQLDEGLERLSTGATLFACALLGGYIAYRLFERWRFARTLQTARVSVDELYDMISRGDQPIVLDVRSNDHRRLDRRQIPGAHLVDLNDLQATLAAIPRDREVVVYCACPNEAASVTVALKLRASGFRRVRPLAGGIDAWESAGFAVHNPKGSAI